MKPGDDAGAAQEPPAIAPDSALFLDIDGCLLDFADDPAAVRAGPRLRAALDALAQRLHGALALVSGRSLAALDAIFAPAVYPAAGLHGLEWRGGEAAPAAPGLRAVRDAAGDVLAVYPGAMVEDKGAAIALHWRAAPAAATAALEFAAQALAHLPGYRLEPGDHVVELRPAGADKGSAIRAFMGQPPFAGRRPVFAGDDLTDEAGFRAVNAMDGVSVLVGARAGSAARHRLADPAAVLAWLERAP